MNHAIFQKAQLVLNPDNMKPPLIGFFQLIEKLTTSPLRPYAYSKRACAYFNLQQYEKGLKMININFKGTTTSRHGL